MTYRKFAADHLFTGRKTLSGSPVLVTSSDGTILDIIDRAEAGESVESFQGMLCPGFINCHCHLELSHLKGLFPEKTGLTSFVFSVISRRHQPDEIVHEAIRAAEEEMLAGGIVATGDICNNSSTLPQKKLGRLSYYNFIEISGWAPSAAAARFAAGKSVYDDFLPISPSGNRLAMAPHAPYSVSGELWRLIAPYFKNRTTTMHNQEAIAEDELFRKGTGDFIRMYEMMKIDNSFFRPPGTSSLQASLKGLAGASNVLLVHNTFTREEDLRQSIGKKGEGAGVFLCLCVNANLYIEDALPPIELFRQHDCRMVLGTDSLASNRQLSILEEIRTIRQHFPRIPLEEILGWATRNGAAALQMDGFAGSFEKGKKPGILLIEHLQGMELTGRTAVKRLL